MLNMELALKFIELTNSNELDAAKFLRVAKTVEKAVKLHLDYSNELTLQNPKL